MEEEMGSQTMALPALNRTEWQAVAIAMNDADVYSCGADAQPGALARLFRAVTGTPVPQPLADPRLESLRRFVCATRRSRRPAEQHIPALLDHGFNQAQVQALALLAA
jgi:hypothetical protein